MTDGRFRKLSDTVSVATQLQAEDFKAAHEAGFHTIINNRPDDESLDQMPSDEAQASARALGIRYLHIPVETGRMTQEAVDAFGKALAEERGPILAYCRSGTRSTYLWAFNAAREQSPEAVIAAAAAAGYDLGGLRPMLERINASARDEPKVQP